MIVFDVAKERKKSPEIKHNDFPVPEFVLYHMKSVHTVFENGFICFPVERKYKSPIRL
jgi:hypothetical protein